MIKVAFVEKVREAERAAFSAGTSEDELIARAAKSLASACRSAARGGKILCVAGGGNNGSDALETAIILKEEGRDVEIALVGNSTNEFNAARREKAKSLGIRESRSFDGFDVIVDGIFGIGLGREVADEALAAVEKINASGAYVIAADVPSGLGAESGRAFGAAVEANETISFIAAKLGTLIGEGRNYVGKLSVDDLGVECECFGSVTEASEAVLPKRKIVSHKGNYGRVKIVGGSETMPGAPYLSFVAAEAAETALRAGAGLVTLCAPRSLAAAYQARVTENTLYFLPDDDGKILFDENAAREIVSGANAIVLGNGTGKSDEIAKYAVWFAREFKGTLVLDADALNSLVGRLDEIRDRACELILTPHVGEFDRLCGEGAASDVGNAINLAKRLKATVCLKSATTVVTDGERVRFNLTGTPAMAKGGSGDVLAGITGAFSCVVPAFEAATAACYAFGKAGERAAERLGSETSVLARDVVIESAKFDLTKEIR